MVRKPDVVTGLKANIRARHRIRITRRSRYFKDEISLRTAVIERADFCPSETMADLVEALHRRGILTADDLAMIVGPSFDLTEVEERDGKT
jgi:hypothetical protein